MRYNYENGVLTLYPEGNIDTSNAEEVGAEINEIRTANPEGRVVLDLDDLKYISSAGLRQILKLKKRENNLQIINCSSDIYEVFDMTGFAEMMDISKGYRKMSVDGCEVIGEGSNGKVYRLNPDTIIKVYKNNDALDDIKRERELAKTALVMGINTAIPFDVVKVGDNYGAVFELLSAKSLTKLIIADPDNKEMYVKIFADFLKEIHQTPVKPGLLPDAKQTALKWADYLKDHIPEADFERLHSLIEAVPDSNMMVHGDYHTNNVHYANGEAILIDMDTLSVGNPVFEFASIYLAYRGFGEMQHNYVSEFLKIDWDTAQYILEELFRQYFNDKDDEYRAKAMDKARVVGYTRLLRRTLKRHPENVEQIEYTKKQLLDLIYKVDDLAL